MSEKIRSRKYSIGQVALTLLAGIVGAPEIAQSTEDPVHQKVFIDSVDNVVLDINRGRLRIRPLKPKNLISEDGDVYLVDGKRFFRDWKLIKRNYEDLSVSTPLRIKDEALYWDGKPVTLPAGVKMRDVWQAVLWRGWVILLGRTSKSDETAAMRPPFYPSELLTFRTDQREVTEVRWLSFQPPGPGPGIYVLTGK